MRARVADYPSGPVIAFGGFEYIKNEWRDVPPGFESAAEAHAYLEIEPEPKPKPTTRRRRATKPKGTK